MIKIDKDAILKMFIRFSKDMEDGKECVVNINDTKIDVSDLWNKYKTITGSDTTEAELISKLYKEYVSSEEHYFRWLEPLGLDDVSWLGMQVYSSYSLYQLSAIIGLDTPDKLANLLLNAFNLIAYNSIKDLVPKQEEDATAKPKTKNKGAKKPRAKSKKS